MQEYLINLIWDNEAGVWYAVNDEIPIALESGSFDALIERVKIAVPEMLAENNLIPESKSVQLTFCAERTYKLEEVGTNSSANMCWHEDHIASPTEGEDSMAMTDLQFYAAERDKRAELEKEIALLREENQKLIDELNVLRETKLKLPALDADVTIDGDNVTIANGKGETIQINKEEWETLREKWRFDDVVDYERGETGMTLFQLRSCIEVSRRLKELEAEKERLLAEKQG